MIRTILLYGELGDKFGREWHFHVNSPAEAIKALMSQVKGFKQYVTSHQRHGFAIFVDKELRDPKTLYFPCSSAEPIKLVPYVGGAGGDSMFGVLLGGALLALTFWNPGSWFIAAGSLTTFGQITFAVGMGLVLGGVAQMLAPAPQTMSPADRPENKPSFSFNGPVNTVAQGNAFALCYGRCMAGSQVLSSGLYTEQIAP